MLNRRYLRIKVYQSLYAYWQSDHGSAARIEQELFLSIDRTFDLYLSLLLTFGELRRAAEQRLEDRRQKQLPTEADLRADRRFVDGALLTAITASPVVEQEASRRRLGWVGHNDIFQKLLRQVEADERFKAFMVAAEVDVRMERDLLLHLFLEHVAHFEPLHDLFESRSIYWLEDLDLACSLVKRTLEDLSASGLNERSLSDALRSPTEERVFVSTLFRRCIDLSAEHEEAIGAKANNWELERIALSDMILMKMALTEAREFPEIPVKVTLNEYIEIAKAYSTPKSKGFINGILDKLFIEMKADGRIRKVGRGLLEN